MFSPKLYIPSNIRGNKPKNSLITDTFQNNAVSLLDWLGIDLTNGSSSLVLSQAGTWVSNGSPSLPLNSIQYNNGGVFQGDSLFTRNFITKDTIIGQASGTVAFGLQQNSDILGLGLTSGSFNYYSDSASDIVGMVGTGDDTASAGFAGTSALFTFNTTTQDFARIKTYYDTDTSEMVVLEQAINGNTNSTMSLDSTEARLYYTNDDGVTSSKFIAESSDAKIFTENAGVEYFARLTTTGVFEIYNNTTSTSYFKVDVVENKLTINLDLVPTYADDAAAITGTLTSGDVYKTTTLGSTYLKIVP
jgi:hypothetical protein